MQKKTAFFICFYLLLFNVTTAQPKNQFNSKSLQIKWEFISNNFQQQQKVNAKLYLTNSDKINTLPAKGWQLYFNAVHPVYNKDTMPDLVLSSVMGSLYKIIPTSSFKGLAIGATISLDYFSKYPINNQSEVPCGFYLVWDSLPSITYPVTNITAIPHSNLSDFKKSDDDKSLHVTPATVYASNKTINDIPLALVKKITPTPSSYKEKEGEYKLSSTNTIYSDKKFENEALYLSEELKHFFGKNSIIQSNRASNIQLIYDEQQLPEGYSLTVSQKGITISASDTKGIFYGIQSLKCLFPLDVWKNKIEKMIINCVSVNDAPRFEYRGLMLDVSRNFQTKEELLKILDLMAMYKLNVLHFHFSDDEAWRLEIPGLPELTSLGTKRGHTINNKNNIPPTFGSGGAINEFQSKYYTRKDFIEILKYAKARHIDVIPEVESPGHARAAIKAMLYRYERLTKEDKYKEASQYLLSDLNDQSTYQSVQNYSDNVLCPCLPSAFNFIEKISDELISMYKEAGCFLKTIHMGGDEVPEGVWEKSPACHLFSENDTTYKKPSTLWIYYWKKVSELLKSKGLFISGWEEIGMQQVVQSNEKKMVVNPEFSNANFHTYVWNNLIGSGSEDLPYKLANSGYKVILCPVTNLYFDLAYQNDFNEPGYYWGGFVDIDKPYYYIPFDYYKNTRYDKKGNPIDTTFFIGKDRLTEYGKKNIKGIQGHLWGENLTSGDLLEYQAFPKILGLAERAWAADPEWATTTDKNKSETLYLKSYNEFINTVGKRELTKLAWFKGGIKYRIPTVGAIIENGILKANVQFPGFQIRYTINGSEPTLKSKLYENPLSVKGMISLRAFDTKGRGGRSVKLDVRQ